LDALNNLTDALSSIITIIGTKLSGKKPDKKHPYGYGRIEYLTSVIIAALILFAGASAIYDSVKGIIEFWQTPEAERAALNPNYPFYTLIIIGVAVLVKIFLGLFFRKRGKSLSSENLVASGTDALFDSVLSLSTLIAALITYFSGVSIENYLGIVIGCFIVKTGIEILLSALSSIIGQRAEGEETKKLRDIILSEPAVRGVYDIIINKYGPSRIIASAHIEVDDGLTAKDLHRITRRLTALAYKESHVILTLGIYASNDSSNENKKMKDLLFSLVKEHPEILQCHGFYVDEEHKAVSFDLIYDFECKNPMEITGSIEKKLQESFPEFTFYPILDSDFSDLE
jgi:cation diffusion facilitator family transporter